MKPLAPTNANSTHEPTLLISDDLLAQLANPDYDATRGEFDAETRATLATALPEICNELLARRQMDNPEGGFRDLVNAKLAKARAALRTNPKHLSNFQLFLACETILEHSKDATERSAAQEVRDQIRRAA